VTFSQRNGVDVEVIVDKSSARQSKSGSHYSAATYLKNAGIPVWVDTKVAIAHNKVMVIDGETVITGSFNFTAAAQNHNAENLMVLVDPALATQYKANWERRRSVSTLYVGALPPSAVVEAE
jgi:phosphatidylserine/phosphatidylglycerophosphate/cardiolipin synthase-like enzyme